MEMQRWRLSQFFSDYRRILKLGFPVLVSQIGIIIVGFADNIMVGNYSTEALASASFVNNVFNLPLMAALGFSYGLTPLVGALFAKGDKRKIGMTLRAGAIVNLLVALLLMGIMGMVYLLLPRLDQPEALLPLIRPYMLIHIAGLLPVALFNAFAQWSYGIRNTAMPMWIMLGANALNIFGNYLLIYGHWGMPELGLTGAGLSTLAARIVCAVVIICVFLFEKRYSEYRAGFATPPAVKGLKRKVTNMSWPVGLQMGFETAAFSGCAVMCGWLGEIDMAAYQIIIIIGTLGFCIYYAMGTAIAVLVSNESGIAQSAAQPLPPRVRMRRKAVAGYAVILTCCLASSLFFGLGARHVMHIFTADPAVLAVAVSVILPLVLYQLGDATQITFANALRGTGNVRPMMWISFFCYMIAGIPSSYLLAFPCGMGLYGIVLSFSISLFLAGALFLYYFLRTTRVEA